MKRRLSKAVVSSPTFESAVDLVRAVFAQYLDPSLLKPQGVVMGNKRSPLVSWFLAAESRGGITLSIKARWGCMSEYTEVTVRWVNHVTWVTRDWITHALFAALTFNGSPYRWDDAKSQWLKRIEVMG